MIQTIIGIVIHLVIEKNYFRQLWSGNVNIVNRGPVILVDDNLKIFVDHKFLTCKYL